LLGVAAFASILPLFVSQPNAASAARAEAKTVVLVHGAFAESSSWNPVISRLEAKGFRVVAVANPLRGLKTDAEYLDRVLASISGPVVLVGHSYGGEVISEASGRNVVSLVFVAGVAPEPGESAASLGARFPTGTLGATLAPPVPLGDGQRDLYIDQSKFWRQFAADSPRAVAAQMAATQRPITEAALSEPAQGEQAWHRLPSWFIYGSLDRNIPRALHAFMANRAHGKEIVEIKGASHALMVSHPAEVTALIERAAVAQ
jgi:pimeloyl-ACP methyl ester carboxylesterase